MKKIISIIGARPQFIKHAPIERVLNDYYDNFSIHTGQHYDKDMSDIFFKELNIKKPKYNLNVGSLPHGAQTGKIMIDLEPIIVKEKPDALIVYGDTNSTVAGSLVASKLHIPVIHIEAGLRSFNKEMPEEINRILTDHSSMLLFASTEAAVENLKKEGIFDNVFLTGDIMIDSIKYALTLIEQTEKLGDYYYATIHRPYNTDNTDRLIYVLNSLNALDKPVKFPLHPRTENKMKKENISKNSFKNIVFSTPVSYIDNINNLYHSHGLITDSGGMQKEAYVLKKRCITIRTETEWVETLAGNWNTLVFDDLEKLNDVFKKELGIHHELIYGDGKAAEDIINTLNKFFL